MSNNVNKIIVKVGDRSDISFRKVKAFRAITMSELDRLVLLNPDACIVVIEHIEEYESEKIKAFINNFIATGDDYRVFFYIKDNDDITCGIADELNYDIYMRLTDLHKAINSTYAINVSTNVDTFKLNDTSSKDDDEDTFQILDKSFDEAIETISIKDDSVEVIKHPTINSKDDLEFAGYQINSDSEDTENESVKTLTLDEEKFNTEKEKSTDEVLSILHTIKREKDDLQDRLNNSIDRINKLIELKEVIEDERDMYKNMLSSINQDDDIIEDPIGLAEYENIQKDLENTKEELRKAKEETADLMEKISSGEVVSAELEQLKAELSEWKAKAAELDLNTNVISDNINNLREENNRLQQELKAAHEKLEVYVDSDNKITELNSLIDKLNDKLTVLKNELDNKNREVHIESMGRLKMMQMLSSAVNEIDSIEIALNEKTDEISRLRTLVENLKSTKVSNEEKIQQLEEKIIDLTKLSEDADKRVDIAKSYVQKELDKVKTENIRLQTKLELATDQLKIKENAYNNIVAVTGFDESGVSTVLENAKNIEAFNKRLREQNAALITEKEAAIEDKKQAVNSLKRMEKEFDSLREKVRVMTSGTGASGAFTMPALNYSGKGYMVSVFGSGSYGTTTTAMSIANKLSAQAKVLYIDFDLVMPKADGWFKKNPMLRSIPGIKITTKTTGLGILVDYGVSFWIENATRIIQNVKITKGGCIDYVSGLYVKPDLVKLISADFSTFLTYCTNNYGYIIVDFGRLGSSEISDKILKIFTDRSYRNIMVTQNNVFEIQVVCTKTTDAGIDLGNVSWLLNLCTDTKLHEKSKPKVELARNYGLIPFCVDLYGKATLEEFSNYRLTRDKFNMFWENTIG